MKQLKDFINESNKENSLIEEASIDLHGYSIHTFGPGLGNNMDFDGAIVITDSNNTGLNDWIKDQFDDEDEYYDSGWGDLDDDETAEKLEKENKDKNVPEGDLYDYIKKAIDTVKKEGMFIDRLYQSGC